MRALRPPLAEAPDFHWVLWYVCTHARAPRDVILHRWSLEEVWDAFYDLQLAAVLAD